MKALLILIIFAAFDFASASGAACTGNGASEVCTDSASLTLSGLVGQACSILINPTEKASTLDIRAGENEALVATTEEKSNGSYEVSISSLNGGNLMNASNATAAALPYSISYDNQGATSIGATATVVKSVLSDVATQSISDVKITFAGLGDGAVSGNYTDNLVFTITSL